MIILDLNQVMIASLMMQHSKNMELNEDLLRHMILNSIRYNKNHFQNDFGDEFIIACDDKNYWRKKYFPYYKASRKSNREKSGLDWNAIFTILNKVRDELKEFFPYPTIQVETAEADDVIAALCKVNGRQLGGSAILILSGDKDFVQLQKYSNVSQYDPTRKKWIVNQEPNAYLIEHIVKGDTGDGIPNILSEDDVFVAQGRQKPIRSKFLNEVLKSNNPEKCGLITGNVLRNFQRNKKLIDLEEIPDHIFNGILEEYENQSDKGREHLFNYFIKHKLKNLTECIAQF